MLTIRIEWKTKEIISGSDERKRKNDIHLYTRDTKMIQSIRLINHFNDVLGNHFQRRKKKEGHGLLLFKIILCSQQIQLPHK